MIKMAMLFFILQCFYFMMPAYFANMAPIMIRNSFKVLAIPIDGGLKLGGKPLFGANKTIRGFLFAILFAIVVSFIQNILFRLDFFSRLSFFDYSNWLLFGFLMGFGAIFGDLIKSFIKRRIGVAPGKPFIPWDQTDFVFGALIFSDIMFDLSWKMVFSIVIISFFGHIAINHTAYYLKIRNEKW